MAVKLQAIRGMRDILPEQSPKWQQLEQIVSKLLRRYSYQEIRSPIVEKTELFHRSIGELTDIVSKEMYSFDDRNGDSLTLRPEGTASCVRAGLEHGLFHNQTQKLWYMGPMFRHERPQMGRQRQFHQVGVEAFGFTGPDIDAEMLFLCARLWQELGISDVRLEINSLGTAESRNAYRDILVSYFSDHKDQLDEDSLKRLNNNPLRILDSKNPDMKSLIQSAPVFSDYIDEESKQHFADLLELLDAAKLDYTINPLLVRGLDYYGKTVFEWVTEQLGAQGTICAGGRFDGLVTQFAGKPTPAIGFAMGLERIIGLLEGNDFPFQEQAPDIYLISSGHEAEKRSLSLAEQLRDSLPELNLLTHCGGGSFKSQFKKADRSGARLALILGDDELAAGTISIKFLREKTEQITVNIADLTKKLAEILP